jgi:hypothetical protein
MNQNQLLRDEATAPTGVVIADALGLAYTAYSAFCDKLAYHGIDLGWRYYNDGKSWLGKGLYKWTTSRGTEKETTAFWLSVWEGLFKVTFYIPEKHRADALNLPLCDDTKRMIDEAKQMGKLKFFPVTFDISSDDMFGDVLALADFRKLLK